MIKTVDLSMLFQNADWPTELSQEQRQQLLQQKIARAEVYRSLSKVRNKNHSTHRRKDDQRV